MIQVKIDGLSNLQDSLLVADLGVDYLGFLVDVEKNPASLSHYSYYQIAQEVKSKFPNTKLVVSTKNLPKPALQQLVDSNLIDILEFQGQEDVLKMSDFYFQLEVWKKIFVFPGTQSLEVVKELETYKNYARKFVLESTDLELELDFNFLTQVQKYGYDLVINTSLPPEKLDLYLGNLFIETLELNKSIRNLNGDLDKTLLSQYLNYLRRY